MHEVITGIAQGVYFDDLDLEALGVTRSPFKTLYSFSAPGPTYSTNSDGVYPYAALIGADNSGTRYGTAANGGSLGVTLPLALRKMPFCEAMK